MNSSTGGRHSQPPAAWPPSATSSSLSLPGPNEVEELLWGEEGIAEHLRRGTVLVDTTTSSPTLDARIAPSLRDAGVEFVDVGVAGGVRAARAGTATLMVGASALDVRPG